MRAIAIDGPAAAGKGTTAKRIAAELGYTYCDTGALYRALAVGFLDRGLNNDSSVAEFESVLHKLSVSLETRGDGELHVFLNGEDVTGKIRTEEVSSLASVTSAIPSVRAHLNRIQRSIAQEQNIVMEGRDIGTVILPQADLKIYLTADPEERAHRRHKDLVKKGEGVTIETVLKDLNERDARDSSRAAAPLKPAPDAVRVDNTHLTIDETVDLIVNLAKRRFADANKKIDPPMPAEPITEFRGQYEFLSNFNQTLIEYEGITFRNSEAAFQAAKTMDMQERKKFANLSAHDAKRMGRRIALRPDWEQVKDDVMLQILRVKFAPGTKYAKMLVATGTRPLIEGNVWHDNYWGACQCEKCKGKNKLNRLGKLLQQVRLELTEPELGRFTEKVQTDAKKVKNFAVIFNYSFDPECKAYLFEDEESAKKFLRESFDEEVRIDTEENEWENTESTIQENGWYARIVNHFDDRDDVTEMRIAQIAS